MTSTVTGTGATLPVSETFGQELAALAEGAWGKLEVVGEAALAGAKTFFGAVATQFTAGQLKTITDVFAGASADLAAGKSIGDIITDGLNTAEEDELAVLQGIDGALLTAAVTIQASLSTATAA